MNEKPNNIFTLKFMKKDSKDIEGGRCMREKDGNRRDGVVVRASASQSVGLGFIP